MLSDPRVLAVDADGNQVYSWSVFKCLYCEVDHDGSTYVLSAGKWYRIDRDFVEAVDKSFASIPRATEAMPAYKHSGEGAYCSAIAAAHADLYALMDQKTIQIAGRYDKIEFCDLFSATKDLIHVKRYGASSVLNHLFAQGHISAEVFRSEPEFRTKALALLPAPFRWDNEPPSPADFRVVFAIVSAKAGDLSLPFFSRVNLRQSAKRLEAYGYRVAVLKIAVDEIFAKTQKYPAH